MLRRSALAQRSLTEWAVRGALAAAAVVLGYTCAAGTLAEAVARSNPALAHYLAPRNGRVTARLAITLSGPKATIQDRKRADAVARQALLQDPAAVSAAETLGLNAEVRGDHTQARQMFAFSQTLSRRSLQTQLWAIEDAVARNDIPGALSHYDIALRTTKSAPDLLFPVLASAATDPVIRVALIKTLAAKPSWGEDFVTHVANHGPDPRSAAVLFLGLRAANVAVPESARALAINALIGINAFEEAWALYASARPRTDRRMSRDPRFLVDTQSPSAFDWVPVNEGGVSTSIQRGDNGGLFDFAVSASVGGTLLQQMQLLPPGSYRLSGHSSGIEQEERARPYWVLTCRQDGRELGRVSVPNSAQANGRFEGSLTVAAGCPVQILMLVAHPSDALGGLSGQIDRVQLAPAS